MRKKKRKERLKMVDVPREVQEWLSRGAGAWVSAGNEKLSNIPNLSLVPGVDCPGKTALCEKYCYARGAVKRSPTAQVRWSLNSHAARSDLERFRRDVVSQIAQFRSDYFRIHVGGDFVSQEYLETWKSIACDVPRVRFLAFTKCFGWDYSDTPSNLVIMWSVFPDSDLEAIPDGPRAYALFDKAGFVYPDSEGDRIAAAFKCIGTCEACGMCFHAYENNVDVRFKAHGSYIRFAEKGGVSRG